MTRRSRSRLHLVASSADRRAVLWARVSTDRQAERGYSLDAQVAQLREYAHRAGLDVVAEHVVSESASREERRAFDAMLREVGRSSGPRHLLAAEADRLSRSLASDARLDELRRAGLSIHLVREGRVLGPAASSSELLLLDARAMVARYESRHHGERVRLGMGRKARAGLLPSVVPLGYRRTSPAEPVEPDPHAAPIIAELYRSCADGAPLDRLAEIARRRDLRGRGGAHLNRSTIAWILRSPVYQGDVEWSGETYRGLHAPLVTRGLWSRAQVALDARRTGGRRVRGEGHDLELAGVLRCGACDRSLVGELHVRGRRHYVYYRCARGARCAPGYVREEVLREAIAGALDAVRPADDVAHAIRRALTIEIVQDRRDRGSARARLLAEQTRLERRLDAAYTDAADGRITREQHDRLVAGWRADQERVRAELAGLDEGYERGLRTALDVLDVTLRAGTAYRRADRGLRREILGLLTTGGTWADGRLALELAQVVSALADTSCLEAGRPGWWPVLDEIRTADAGRWAALRERLAA